MENYKTELEHFYDYMNQHGELVLSTSESHQVASRMVSTFRIDRKLYFQTDCRMTKFKQIKDNPNVALT